MPNSRTRGRRRLARWQAQIDEFTRARSDPAGFPAFVARLAAAEPRVWPVAEESGRLWPLTDDELAVITDLVGPGGSSPRPRHVRWRLPPGE